MERYKPRINAIPMRRAGEEFTNPYGIDLRERRIFVRIVQNGNMDCRFVVDGKSWIQVDHCIIGCEEGEAIREGLPRVYPESKQSATIK